MRRILRTQTALVTSLSLVLSGFPVVAQEGAMICPDGTALPCPEGIEPIPAPAEAAPAEVAPAETAPVASDPAPAEAAPAEAEAPEAAVPEAAPEPAPAEAAPPEAVPAEVAPVESAPVESAPVESVPAEVIPEAVPTESAPAEATAEEPQAEPAPEPAPAAEPQPEPVTETAPAAPEAATEPAPAAEAPQPDPAAEAPAPEPAPEAAPEPAPAEDAPAASAETAPVPEPAAEAPSAEDLEKALAEQSGETAPPAEAIAEPTAPTPTEVIAGELKAEGVVPSTEVVPLLPEQPDAASGAAPVAAAAEMLAPATEGGAAPSATAPAPAEAVAQVTEEVVTQENVRSSSEDFSTKVNQAAKGAAVAAPKAAPVAVERDEGLSDVEKLLLLGAGALVVGAILSNNRKVEMNSGDRVVVSRDGQYYVMKDDDALLRQPGSKVRTETFRDGSTRTTVTRTDGSRIVTIRDAEMRVLRRVHVDPYGRETLLIDDTLAYDPVDVTRLPKPVARPVLTTAADEAALRAALAVESVAGRTFSLAQVRDIAEVRAFAPIIDLDAITFESGSAAIRPDQARALAGLGKLIQSYVRDNPREMFLIEGHTDAVGSAAYNLALSDRRAESVALALTEYFAVPPENLVVQGYGEQFLKVDTQAEERANRRASIRRITSLLR